MNLEKINLTEELVLKASACKTQEELLALAHENGVTITMEQLPELMAEIAKKCSGEISDDALEMAGAVGGKGGTPGRKPVKPTGACQHYRCAYCNSLAVCYAGSDPFVMHHTFCKASEGRFTCMNCYFAISENGLLICTFK